MNTVFIERGERDYAEMWRRWGWAIANNPMDADVIQFTGGSDVNPALYGEAVHPHTGYSVERDERCLALFKMAKAKGKPMAGICRGGQFLNVANGGKMFQHVNGHAINGTHKATILDTGLVVDVTSTHHQMIRPTKEAIVLMISEPLGTYKQYMSDKGWERAEWYIADAHHEDDIEAVYYDDSNSLCFQPHPEWCKETSGCVQAYKYMLRNYLGLDV